MVEGVENLVVEFLWVCVSMGRTFCWLQELSLFDTYLGKRLNLLQVVLQELRDRLSNVPILGSHVPHLSLVVHPAAQQTTTSRAVAIVVAGVQVGLIL